MAMSMFSFPEPCPSIDFSGEAMQSIPSLGLTVAIMLAGDKLPKSDQQSEACNQA